MRDTQACMLLLVAMVVLVTLLLSANMADEPVGSRDWDDFSGPFMWLYLLLLVLCCIACTPFGWYWCTYHRNKASLRADPSDAQHLNRAIGSIALSFVLLGLATACVLLLSLQLDAIDDGHKPHWGAFIGVLLAAEIVVFLYVIGSLWMAASRQYGLLHFCCNIEYFGEAPVCLGGSDNGLRSGRSTPVQRWTLAYHASLVVGLLLVIIATGMLLPVLNGASHHIGPPAVLLCIALAGTLVTAVGLLVVGFGPMRQTVFLALAALLAMLLIIFIIQVAAGFPHTGNDVHLLFAPLYVAFAVIIVALMLLAVSDVTVSEELLPAVATPPPPTPPVPTKSTMHINWEALS